MNDDWTGGGSGPAGDGILPPPPPPTPAMPTSPALGDMLLSIGDIAVYQAGVVTPSGHLPHRGLTWIVRDNSVTTETMPAYAIVLCLLFVWACLLGLLFLLIKERTTQGYIEVSVQSPSGYHVTQIRATSPQQIDFVRQQVDYCRSLVHYT